jgi:protein SCO1
VILTLNYYRCPMLCGLMLNGMLDAMKSMAWTAGQEYQVVTVSFDPAESAFLARAKKQSYLEEYARPPAAGGWHFLTGMEPSIKALTDAVGFGYKWNDEKKEWMHPAAIYICTPDGRISRYLYGVMFEPQTLRLSLVEAAAGKVGSTSDRFLLFCYHYDPRDGKYSLAVMNLVRGGGVLTTAALGIFLASLWRAERRRRRALAGSAT